jgi:hypothetical protein
MGIKIMLLLTNDVIEDLALISTLSFLVISINLLLSFCNELSCEGQDITGGENEK